MKILWITNLLFPDPCNYLEIPTPIMGGWMYSFAKDLNNDDSIELAVATVYSGSGKKKIYLDGITYYLLPLKGNNTEYQKQLEPLWQWAVSDFSPNIAHLHGTEYAHGLAFLNACPEIKSVVSIQGLVSICEQYYYAGISFFDILKNITFRDVIRKDNIFQQKKKFFKRGIIEEEIIRKTDNVIGRTLWDKAHVFKINSEAKYHFCNETLRSEFYKHTWSYNNCEKYSIFLSQASYPIKGLHQLIKALPSILEKYPHTKVYVAGNDLTDCSSLKKHLKLTGYAKYIKSLISKNNFKEKIIFTGFLNEKEICQQYLKSNVFVCPSSIENSPNSLGEAQIMGVPSIASYVGGTPDMITYGETGLLYRFEEFEMLAQNICSIFNNSTFVNSMSVNGNKAAKYRHNKRLNLIQILSIYNKIKN